MPLFILLGILLLKTHKSVYVMRTFKIVLILDARKHILKEIEQCAQGHLLNVIYLYITLLFKNGNLKQRTFIISSLAGEMGGQESGNSCSLFA